MPAPKLTAALIATALAAAAAPAIAETIYVYTPPERTVYVPVETVTTDDYYTYYTAPTTTITVYGTRGDEDALITNDVVTELAFDPWISGTVGVETNNNVVTLNGRVSTPGQALRADADAHRVDGVSEVQNRLKTRVGGS